MRQPSPCQKATGLVATLLVGSSLATAGAEPAFRLGPPSPNPTIAALAAAFQAVTASEQDEVLFEADSVVRDTKTQKIIATGNVKAYFGKQLLEAELVEYDQATDIVIAKGNVAITDAEGQIFYADGVELSGDLSDGIATNFSSLLADNSRLAGTTVLKRNNGNNQLNRAVYTGCEICKESSLTGETAPTWQIKAQQIRQDKSTNTIAFQNAWVEVFGAPVFYTPYLRLPDPTVDRQSGLLRPKIGQSTRLGFVTEVPYYLVISDYQDLTFSPKFMSDRGTLIQGEHRLKTEGGGFVTQLGIITANEGTENVDGQDFNVPGTRFHLFAKGEQRLRRDWRLNYDLDLISDKLYLRSLDVEPEGDLQDPVGLYRPDRLRSNIELFRRTASSFLSIEGLGFQTLRVNENNDYTAQALPRISYESVHGTPMIGGRTTLSSNFLHLRRPDGLSTSRASIGATWDRNYTTQQGHRFTLFGDVRADAYHYQDIPKGTESCNSELFPNVADFNTCAAFLPGGGTKDSKTSTRVLPTLGAEWSFPLAKQTDNATFIIEPKVQLVVSPNNDFGTDFLDEDSQFFEFDTTSLFDWKKSSGMDLWEDGQRANVGIASTIRWENGVTIKTSLGQQFRADESSIFDPLSGLSRKTSDYVGALDVSIGNNFSIENRFRYDQKTDIARRIETRLNGRAGPFRGYAAYLKLDERETLTDTLVPKEFANLGLTYNINENFFVSTSARIDFNSPKRDAANIVIPNQFETLTVEQRYSIGYQDDCTRLSILFRDDNTSTFNNHNSDQQISVQLELGNFR